MKKIKYSIPVIILMLSSGCASFGPTVLIETPEPAEDFVVICEWYKMPFLEFHGGSKVSKQTVHVTESGQELDCGIAWSGGKANALVHHPIYRHPDIVERDGLTVYQYTKTALDILDEQKAKFEAGAWDEHRNPGAEYARSLTGCGFPYQYFDYYSEVKKVDKEHFRKLYHDPILECFKRTFPITKKYRPNAASQLPSPEEWMDKMWVSDTWSEYE